LYSFAKVELLITRYKLRRSTIEKILPCDPPKQPRITRNKRPYYRTNTQVDEIINTHPNRGLIESLTIAGYTTNLGLNALV